MSFSSQFEFPCSELSIICLRIKIWGESNGLDLEADHLPSTLATAARECTTTQCVATIINILTEVETIRQKYEYRRPSVPSSIQDDDKLQPSVSLVPLSKSRAVTRLRQRIRDNQKQKSCLTIAKWTMCDAKKFEDKVNKLRILIDGLEDISAAGSLVTPPTTCPSSPVVSNENPPPYSISTLSQYALEEGSFEEFMEDSMDTAHTSMIRYTFFPEQTTLQEADIEAHYTAMIRYCGIVSMGQDHPRWRAREKLARLTDSQFQELRVDVYDDLYRREWQGLTSLPADLQYHPRRNQARERLSVLDADPFKDLVVDVLFEMQRRFPLLQEAQSPIISSSPRSTFSNRRQHTPPPPLQLRAAHPTTIETSVFEPDTPIIETSVFEADTPTVETSGFDPDTPPASPIDAYPQPTSPQSPTSQPPSPAQSEAEGIFQSFRIDPTVKTSEVLPAALAKYGIDAPPQDYSLYVVYGDSERCLELDEQPLLVFKDLNRQGLKPTFVLRKFVSKEVASAEATVEPVSVL